MKRLVVIGFLTLVLGPAARSQTPSLLQFSLGPQIAQPIGSLGDGAGTAWGAAVSARVGLLATTDIGGVVDYIRFSSESTPVGEVSTYALGVNAFARIPVFPFLRAGLEAGIYRFGTSIEQVQPPATGSETYENKPAIAPVLSARVGSLEASARAVLIKDASFGALRVMLVF